jgi:hypothetical protein
LIRDNKTSDFSEHSQSTLWLGKRICVPNLKPTKELILGESHDSTYSIPPGSTKMYKDLKTQYWWYGMKRDVVEYIALCDTCQRVKAEHRRLAGLLLMEELDLGGDLTYSERPIKILGTTERVTDSKVIKMCKV